MADPLPVLMFLSPEWVDALDEAIRSSTPPGAAGEERRLVVEHVVRRAPTGDVHFHVDLDPRTAGAGLGRPPGPAVTVMSDYAVALAIHRGETSAEQALADGRLKLSGHVGLLAGASRGLSRMRDALAGLRARTVYGPRR